MVAAVVFFSAVQPAQANPEVYKKVMPSVAWVHSRLGDGTGVFVELDGRVLVVTADHVVKGQTEVRLVVPEKNADGKYIVDRDHYIRQATRVALPGKVLFHDTGRDLAVIELERVPAGVKPVRLAAGSPALETTVHLVGCSQDYDGSLWRFKKAFVIGVVQSRVVGAADGPKTVRKVIITGDGHYGDSGGPLVNDKGELVAIASASLINKLEAYYIDVTEIRNVLREMILKEGLAILKEQTLILSAIKDVAGARQAAGSYLVARRRFETLDRLFAVLGKGGDREQQRLQDKYGPDLQAAMAKLQEEQKRIEGNPELKKALLEAALN
jgi:S1-C subfamily serine protease